jgi:hypothetical protein
MPWHNLQVETRDKEQPEKKDRTKPHITAGII